MPASGRLCRTLQLSFYHGDRIVTSRACVDWAAMDWEGKVDLPKLLCAATGSVIEPGTTFWSALLFIDGIFVRRDYSVTAWEALSRAGLLSWWYQTAPKADEKPKIVDLEALLGMFHALKDAHERPKQCFLFVVMLFLVRARKLRYRTTVRENGQGFMLAEDKELKCVYKVRDPHMTAEEEVLVHKNLMDVIAVGTPLMTG